VAGFATLLATFLLVVGLDGASADLTPAGGHSVALANPAVQDRVATKVTAWPIWGFNSARTRVGPAVVLPNPNTNDPLWKQQEIVRSATGELTQFGDLIEYPPSISGGRVFYCTNGGGQGGQVICRDLESGIQLWRYQIPSEQGGQFAAEPAVSGNVVYVGTMGPHKGRGNSDYKPELLALKADSTDPAGTLLWHFTTGHAVESSPMVVGDHLYFSTQSGTLYCFSVASHRPLWSRNLGGKTTSSPAYDQNGHIIAATYAGVVWSFGPGGNVYWKSKLPGSKAQFYGTPAVYGRRVVVASKANGNVYCIDARRGKTLWTCATGQSLYASPAVWNNTVYIGSKSGCFWAIDVRTGAPIWPRSKILSVRYPGPIFGSASVLAGVVYFSALPAPGHKTGTTYAIDGRTGARKWRFADGCYSPVTATSAVVLLTGHHTVYAFAPKP
jgi:outer membrane protein assembly factor BamB